ncbi:MAG: NAD(P)-dependent oxidoreductase [Planctomycetota bacterium]
MKVLVSGANGFLGRHVVSTLLARGHEVRALVRPASRTDHLQWADKVEFHRADLRQKQQLPAAMDGIDAVLHLAAAVAGDENQQFVHAVVGTENLVAAMAEGGVRRMLLCSSCSVYDWSKVNGVLSEDSPLEESGLYDRDGYAIAKRWQERVAQRFADMGECRLTVVRPGLIWGRGRESVPGEGVSCGPFDLVFGPMGRLRLTHAENCASDVVNALEADTAEGHRYNIIDRDSIRTWRWVGERNRRTQGRRIRVPIPYCVGIGVAILASMTSRLLFGPNGKLPGLFVPRRFQARFKPVRYNTAAIERASGAHPALSFEDCLARTFGEGDSGADSPSGSLSSAATRKPLSTS